MMRLKSHTLLVMIASMLPFGAFAQEPFELKLGDIQRYAVQSYESGQVLLGYDLPHSVGDGSTIRRVFEGGRESFQIDYRDGTSWRVPGGGVADQNAIATDPVSGRVAFRNIDHVVLLDTRSKRAVRCELPGQISSDYSITRVGGAFIFSFPEAENGFYRRLALFRIEQGSQDCSLIRIASLSSFSPGDARVCDKDGKITVLLNQSKWGEGTGTSYAETVTLDLDGRVIDRKGFPGFAHNAAAPDVYPRPSVGPGGMLVPLIDSSDPEQRTNLYLLNDQASPRLIAKGAFYGLWVSGARILANRGVHATSSELVLLGGADYSEETRVKQPKGYKRNVLFEDGVLRYTNETRDKQWFGYATEPGNFDRFERLSLRPVIPPGAAELPVVSEVDYPSGDHRVASMLSIPAAGCVPGQKRPVLVFLHGGNYASGAPAGERINGDRDHLLFTQLGWIVLEANYFGDQYQGVEYARGLNRYLDRDRHAKTLQDIQAAGEFALSLPCADTQRMILMGHSNGSIMASLYATDPAYARTSPYSGVVLRNGIYAESEIQAFYGNPRMAVRGGDSRKRINLDDPSFAEYGVPIFQPAQAVVGVDNALMLLFGLEKEGRFYYGVPYRLTESTLDEIVPIRRAAQIARLPILIV
jgi:predicted esterase